MHESILSGRRKVFPIASIPVVVPDHILSFEYRGICYVEPGFATVAPRHWEGLKPIQRQRPDCHGVLHRITVQEMERIVRTEGGKDFKHVIYIN